MALRRLLRQQSGVIARRQVRELGGTQVDIRPRLRRREWVAVHPGVYVDHTGTPTRRQREWAAVLLHWPAALHRESALAAHGLERDRTPTKGPDVVHVVVDAARTPAPTPGIVVERVRDAARWVEWNRRPPRVRLDFALLKVAAGRDEAGAVAVLADAVHQGLTTAARLASTLRDLTRLPGRGRLLALLDDVASGARSVLEQRYLRDVERAHGLPAGERQCREVTETGTVFRDVRYDDQRLLVELDGAFGHRDSEDRWGDLDRDLVAAEGNDLTLRAGWAQVLDPCRLAGIVGRILQRRGWDGSPTPCGPGCPLDRASGETSDDSPASRSA